MKKKPIAMKKGGAPETSLRPKARPLSKKEKERKERDAMIKGIRQKAAMTAGLDDYGRGKAASQGRLKNKSAEKSGPSLFDLLREEKSTDMKSGGKVKKKMGGGKMHRMPDGSMMAGASHGMNYGGKVKKMKHGGKCRGMGAATRGGNFSRDG
jgi:hypothetical protein